MLSKPTEKPLWLNLVLFLTCDLEVQTNTQTNTSHTFLEQLCAAE